MTLHPATLPEICGDGLRVLHAFATWSDGQLATREVLPFSSGSIRFQPNQQGIITSRAQRRSFRPERLFIPREIAPHFLIDNIVIGERSQFAQHGASLPGDMFSTGAIDTFVSFDVAAAGMDIRVFVTYIGANPDGEAFIASMIGTSDGGTPPTARALLFLDDRDHVYRISKPIQSPHHAPGIHARTRTPGPGREPAPSLLGDAEVRALLGAWQEVIGASAAEATQALPRDTTSIVLNPVRVERIDGEELDTTLAMLGDRVTMIDPPRVVTLRVANVGSGRNQHARLYALDDSVDGVILQIPLDFTAPPELDLAGCRPRWLGATAPVSTSKRRARRQRAARAR